MKKLILPAVLIALLALAGCGKGGPTPPPGGNGGGGGNTVDMASATFVQSSITVKAGTSVKFDDPQATGGFHILCLGNNQVCKSDPNGPSELNTSSGVTFNQGDSKSYVFQNAGTYTVTCTVHPNMDVKVIVQ